MSYTPGPWFVTLENNAGSKGTQVWARGGDVRVANCDSGAVSLEGRRADARLIAAAPALLEALELGLASIEHCYHTNDDPGGKLWAAVVAARAAIKAAKGGA